VAVPDQGGATVPRCQGSACGVGGEPALAGVSAEVVDLGTGQVVVLGQDLPAQGVGGGADVAFDVEAEQGRVPAAGPVVGDRPEDAAEGVQVGHRRRSGVGGRLGCGIGLGGTELTCLAPLVPAAGKDGVVLVGVDLTPRVELDGAEGAVGVVDPDGPAERVVAGDGGDSPVDEVGLVVVDGA